MNEKQNISHFFSFSSDLIGFSASDVLWNSFWEALIVLESEGRWSFESCRGFTTTSTVLHMASSRYTFLIWFPYLPWQGWSGDFVLKSFLYLWPLGLNFWPPENLPEPIKFLAVLINTSCCESPLVGSCLSCGSLFLSTAASRNLTVFLCDRVWLPSEMALSSSPSTTGLKFIFPSSLKLFFPLRWWGEHVFQDLHKSFLDCPKDIVIWFKKLTLVKIWMK